MHATTLAAAGVYLVCRFSYLHASAPIVGQTVAWLGGITALLAAFATLAQTDLLKLLLRGLLGEPRKCRHGNQRRLVIQEGDRSCGIDDRSRRRILFIDRSVAIGIRRGDSG